MLTTDGPRFKDVHGRTVLLRGANLGGSSKVPYRPDGAADHSEDFFDHRRVSFVGRPFPLEQADEHFSRLREWGLTFLRFLVTWEAVEHAGPGIYDQGYLDYLYQIIEKAGQHGLTLVIDPHQDVWSRFSGGDGAPGWTFEAVGFDVRQFSQTGAAIVHQVHGDPLPRMIWPTNGAKLAAATMFTLFFGGNDFAPATLIEGEPAQEYLQRHYIAAMQQVASHLRGMPHVTGYDTLNEPFSGYIGWKDLNEPWEMLRIGPSPTPIQSMALGSGLPQEVGLWELRVTGRKMAGTRILNQEKACAWLPGFECVWRENGVWDIDSSGNPRLLQPQYFSIVNGRGVDFTNDYYRPFANRYAEAIRSVDPRALIFLETEPGYRVPEWQAGDATNVVWAPHWYDGYVLFAKDFKPFLAFDTHKGKTMWGAKRIRRSFAEQIAAHKRGAQGLAGGGAPTLIGEFGIAYDMHHKKAYRTGDFSSQVNAWDRSFKAMEDNLVSCTLWNYTADNSNQRGDQWNDEDLSIFSRDQQSDPGDINSGGRALEAVVRPYASKIAGEPLRMAFDVKSKRFEFEFRHDPQTSAPTEIFAPRYQYPKGFEVDLSDGACEYQADEQILVYRHTGQRQTHYIKLVPKRERATGQESSR